MKSLLPKFNNKRVLPVECSCRNCGTDLLARYCHNCGQDYFAGSEKTVGEILYNTVDTVFAWDNKILKTLQYLIFFPGRLTRDFFSGRVIQYVYPAKLFWFITILFFATFNIGGHLDSLTSDEEDETLEVSVKDKPSSIEYVDIPDNKQAASAPISKDINSAKNERMIESKIKQHFADYIPYVMFLLIPFFALLLFMLFYKKKKYYASHMIFALHFHSFVFLFFTVFILVNDFIPESWEVTVYSILLLLPAVYLAIALYVAYRPSIPKLIWKIPLIMLTYGIISLIVLTLFLLAMLRIVEITQGVEIF